MSTRRGTATSAEPIARRCLEILDQMTEQLVASGTCKAKDQERMWTLRADLAKLVHWALHDKGNPDIIARIHDCYRRCAVDLDNTAVLRLVRGTMKGELRKAGINAIVPGIDPALDPPTIILTTRRTIQRLGGAASSHTEPSPALDRKPPARPPTTRARRATPSNMRIAFDKAVQMARERIEREAHSISKPDYLAAVYNDPARKAKLLEQIAAALPPIDHKTLALTIDGFFRDAFKGSYIERTDRMGNRRAHKR